MSFENASTTQKTSKMEDTSHAAGSSDEKRSISQPEKPPSTGYNLFVKSTFENIPQDSKFKNNFEYAAMKWRACTEEEKNSYKTQVNQMWEEYEKKLQLYLLTLSSPNARDRVMQTAGRRVTKKRMRRYMPYTYFKTGDRKDFYV